MSDGATLLIVWHSRTSASEAMAAAAAKGAGQVARLMRANEVEPADLISAAGYLFVCPENLASISGEMKEMFDRCYYGALGLIEGRPYATAIAAGSDGEGAQRQIDRIATGWRLKRVAEPVIVNTAAQTPQQIMASKHLDQTCLDRCAILGQSMAMALELGII